MQRYFAEHLFDGKTVKKNQLLSVENGQVISMETTLSPGDATLLSGLVAPGFVDVQVNGGGGALFNKPSLKICKA